MKITATTNPSTLMFEGRPEIEITGISPRPFGFWLDNKPEFYIRSKTPNAAHLADGAYNEEGICTSSGALAHKLPIVERFRLSEDTDPSTIMFEGHPEVTIGAVTKSPFDNHFYVIISSAPAGTRFGNTSDVGEGNNHGHHPDGTDISKTNPWPRVVPRVVPTIDWHKPVFSTYENGRFEIKVEALVTPIDPARPPYVELRMKTPDDIVWGPSALFTLDGKAHSMRGSSHNGKLTNTPPRRTETVMTTSGVKVLITYLGNEPISAELAG